MIFLIDEQIEYRPKNYSLTYKDSPDLSSTFPVNADHCFAYLLGNYAVTVTQSKIINYVIEKEGVNFNKNHLYQSISTLKRELKKRL